MITLYLASDRVDIESVTQFFSTRPLKHICSFLKECIHSCKEFREAIYFELYAKTNQIIKPFSKVYHPYFTKLENKASSYGTYFYYRGEDKRINPSKCFVGQSYDFVEDFVDYIDENSLRFMML